MQGGSDAELSQEAAPEVAEAAEELAPAKAAPSRPEKLYFVRLPKPDLGDEDIAIEKVKAEFASLKEGCDLLLATLKVERVRQDEAKREFEAADLVFQESRAAQDKWREQLEPLRNANRMVSDQRSAMKENFRELAARSEAELDGMIADVEHSLNHETMSVHEERKLIAQLKKLEQSRPRVRAAEAQNEQVPRVGGRGRVPGRPERRCEDGQRSRSALTPLPPQLEQSREHLDDFRAHKAELERKLDMIRAEVGEAKEIKQV